MRKSLQQRRIIRLCSTLLEHQIQHLSPPLTFWVPEETVLTQLSRLLITRLPMKGPKHKQVKNPISSCKWCGSSGFTLQELCLQATLIFLSNSHSHSHSLPNMEKQASVCPWKAEQPLTLSRPCPNQATRTTNFIDPTWKCKIMVQIRPRVSLGLPSVMSSLRIFTSFTWKRNRSWSQSSVTFLFWFHFYRFSLFIRS